MRRGHVSAAVLAMAVGGLSTIGPAQASVTRPSSDLMEKYLIIGTQDSGAGDAINVQNTELGADRKVLSDGSANPNSQSEAGPNTRDVFYQDGDRWKSDSSPTAGSDPVQAAPIFEGVDFSGNLAVTNKDGYFSLSNVDVFADHGIDCANSSGNACRQSVSDSNWYQDSLTSEGLIENNNGINSGFDSAPLLTQIGEWANFIANLGMAELTITQNIEDESFKDGGMPFVTDLAAADTNGDGIALIDIEIDNGNSDFELNNSDWILDGDGGVFGIFRIVGESNFNISNSSILMSDAYEINSGSVTSGLLPSNAMGAAFVKLGDGDDSSDSVFNFNNVVLNGIGIWDFVFTGLSDGLDPHKNFGNTTEIVVNNGQGCAQFISTKVNMNDVRFNRCAAPVPLPAGLPLILTAIAGLGGMGLVARRQRRRA